MSTSNEYYFEEVVAKTEPKPGFVTGTDFGLSSCQLVGSRVYVVGTLGRTGQTGTTIGVYDLNENQWRWVVDEGENAPFKDAHASFVADDCFYIHGGRDSTMVPNDNLFRLDLVTHEWSECVSSAVRPIKRYWHTWQYMDRIRYFVFFGGFVLQGANAEVWQLRVDDFQWSRATVKGRSPLARYGHCSCVVSDKIIFYGGRSKQAYLDDVQILDCRSSHTLTWSKVSHNLGFFRTFGSLSYMNGQLYIFGGYDENLSDSPDLLVLDTSVR